MAQDQIRLGRTAGIGGFVWLSTVLLSKIRVSRTIPRHILSIVVKTCMIVTLNLKRNYDIFGS